jgi:hypothetical protein
MLNLTKDHYLLDNSRFGGTHLTNPRSTNARAWHQIRE